MQQLYNDGEIQKHSPSAYVLTYFARTLKANNKIVFYTTLFTTIIFKNKTF